MLYIDFRRVRAISLLQSQLTRSREIFFANISYSTKRYQGIYWQVVC